MVIHIHISYHFLNFSDYLMCVVRGIIRKTKYHTPKNELEVEELYVKEIMDLQKVEVHLINDEIGLHKIETLDENQQAVTSHCYIRSILRLFYIRFRKW